MLQNQIFNWSPKDLDKTLDHQSIYPSRIDHHIIDDGAKDDAKEISAIGYWLNKIETVRKIKRKYSWYAFVI